MVNKSVKKMLKFQTKRYFRSGLLYGATRRKKTLVTENFKGTQYGTHDYGKNIN